MPILKNLRVEREARYLTQEDLARLAGCTRATIIAAEQGRTVSPRVAAGIDAALTLRPPSQLARALQGVA
jgi:transcriptional regulator with XRE-family HTH domain